MLSIYSQLCPGLPKKEPFGVVWHKIQLLLYAHRFGNGVYPKCLRYGLTHFSLCSSPCSGPSVSSAGCCCRCCQSGGVSGLGSGRSDRPAGRARSITSAGRAVTELGNNRLRDTPAFWKLHWGIKLLPANTASHEEYWPIGAASLAFKWRYFLF